MIVLILHMELNKFRDHFISSLKDYYPRSEITAFYRRLTDFYFQWPPTFSVLNPKYLLNKEELYKLYFVLDWFSSHLPTLVFYIRKIYIQGKSTK